MRRTWRKGVKRFSIIPKGIVTNASALQQEQPARLPMRAEWRRLGAVAGERHSVMGASLRLIIDVSSGCLLLLAGFLAGVQYGHADRRRPDTSKIASIFAWRSGGICVTSHFRLQPCFGEAPVILDGLHRYIQHFRRFGLGQAAKEMQFDYLSLACIQLR